MNDKAKIKDSHGLKSMGIETKPVRFETQESKEEVVLFLRQHVIVNTGWVLSTMLLFMVPRLFFIFVEQFKLFPQLPPQYLFVLPLFWYSGTISYAFVNFLNWYFNIYIVTNERVVDIDWVNLLYKQITTAKLYKIEDVTSRQGGVIGALFNFGNVMIQTAGEENNIEFIAVPNPTAVVRDINQLIG